MIARVLLFVKHRLPWLWLVVDWLNAWLFSLLHLRRMAKEVEKTFSSYTLDGFDFRPLGEGDLKALRVLLEQQGAERLKYFQPHGFDEKSLHFMHRNPAFLMFGAFHESQMVGYFFLRCFWNRKCFVGRLIDEPFEKQGIGRVMNQIMYHSAWSSGFRCFTTVSKTNTSVIRSHSRNPHMKLVGALSGDYLLLEFSQIGGEQQDELLKQSGGNQT